MIPSLVAPSQVVRSTVLNKIDGVVLLAVVVLGIVACLMVAPPVLLFLNVFLVLVLVWTGMMPDGFWFAIRPWLPVAGVVLMVHVLTTTASAPLGHPSWGGLEAGILALARIAASFGFLAIFSRLKSLDDLVRAVRWWLGPLDKLGLPIGHLALVLAVALGTVPGVMNEGRRVDAVLRMRRAQRGKKAVSRWLKWKDKLVVVVPLAESLLRRADVLSLSLRTRQPTQEGVSGPSGWQLAFLGVWTVFWAQMIWLGVSA